MKTWLAFLVPTLVFGTDHIMDVTPSIVYPQTADKSSFELDYRIINDFAGGYTIVNPRFKPLGNGNFSSSLGIGHRFDFDQGLLGLHIFGDHSYINKSHFLQYGPSLDFIGNRWDYRVNGYFPLYEFQKVKLIQPHYHFDHEIVYKTKYIHFGLGHNYGKEKHGCVGRISMPIGGSLWTLSCGNDPIHGNHVKLAVSFALPYGEHKDHLKPVQRQITPLHTVLPVKVKIVRIPVKPQGVVVTITPPTPAPTLEPTPKEPEIAVIESSIEKLDPDNSIVMPPEMIPPPPKGWKDFFFNKQPGNHAGDPNMVLQ